MVVNAETSYEHNSSSTVTLGPSPPILGSVPSLLKTFSTSPALGGRVAAEAPWTHMPELAGVIGTWTILVKCKANATPDFPPGRGPVGLCPLAELSAGIDGSGICPPLKARGTPWGQSSCACLKELHLAQEGSFFARPVKHWLYRLYRWAPG